MRSEEPGGGEARLADASLIHELAIKGAEDLEREDAQRRRLLDELSDPDLTAARLDGDALREVLALRAENPFGSDA